MMRYTLSAGEDPAGCGIVTVISGMPLGQGHGGSLSPGSRRIDDGQGIRGTGSCAPVIVIVTLLRTGGNDRIIHPQDQGAETRWPYLPGTLWVVSNRLP